MRSNNSKDADHRAELDDFKQSQIILIDDNESTFFNNLNNG
jgi:hypothetical protein